MPSPCLPGDGHGADPLFRRLHQRTAVRYGEAVCLRAATGRCVDVEGLKVKARWFDGGDWQSFLLCPTAEALRQGAVLGGELRQGDEVRLLAHTGACVAVQRKAGGERA